MVQNLIDFGEKFMCTVYFTQNYKVFITIHKMYYLIIELKINYRINQIYLAAFIK